MKAEAEHARRRVGRPLSFDREDALRKAMLMFWRHGYEGTSIADLTSVMGIAPPSLYTAFGNKKQLFLEAVGAYLSGPVTSEDLIRDAPSARHAARQLMDLTAWMVTGIDTPPGCLVSSSALSCSASAADVQVELSAIRSKVRRCLADRIRRDVSDGKLPTGTDAEALANLVSAVTQGMSTLAKDGVGRDEMLDVARSAMEAWPPERR